MNHAIQRILVVEPKWTGHYAGFAARVAEGLRLTGRSVTLALTASGPDETTGITEVVEEAFADRLDIRRTLGPLPRGFSPITERGGELEWHTIESEIEQARADVVVAPSADAIACTRDAPDRCRRSGVPLVGCIHNARLGYRGHGPRFLLRREWMRRRLARCGMTLGTLDPVAVEAGRRIPLHPLPHPASGTPGPDVPDSMADLEDRIGDRRVILAIGEHSLRKGTDRIVAHWPEPAPDDAVLVVAGRRCAAVDEALGRRTGDVEASRILDIPRTLSGGEFDWLVHRADVVTAVYQQHVGISGIVAEAAASGTAVLGSAEGGIGRQIQAHGLGQTIRSRDDRALAEALARAAIDDPEVDETRRTAFAREGRDPAFGQAWLRLLDLAKRDR